ncbi:ComEC/Rec2 family competence protein [Rugosimonospora acidiphila]|uniref:ComEC/Rec2 family competence protein n=1 Tax=Rugosimonospora acidiphila TaxID=556531 RepID=A0ABP9RRG4_9ACTN
MSAAPERDRRSARDQAPPRRALPDLRLAGIAVGAWSTALGCLYVSAVHAAELAAAAALLAAGAGFVRRLGPARWLVVAVLLGSVCGATATAARLAVRDAQPLAGLVRRHASVQLELTVAGDPKLVGGTAGRPPLYLVPASASTVRTEDGRRFRLDAGVLVLADDPAWRALLPGTPVLASGRLSPPDAGDLTAAVLSASAAPDRTGRAPWVQRAAGALRSGLRRACEPLPSGPGGLLPGLVDGDTAGLDLAVADDFRATGMTHLVAVSGANVAYVLGAVLLLARWCRAGPRLAGALCTVALVGFVILARPSPSVLRAAAMGGLGLLALVSGRPRAAVPGLAATVVILILVSPALAGDPGFALSAFATAGLLLIAPRWRDALRRRRVPAGLAEALAIPAAAEVACAPVIAAISGTVSLVAVPANLVADPAVAPATVVGVAAASVSTVWPAGAAFLAWLASWPARWLVGVARIGASVPSAVVTWPGGATGGLLLALILLVGVVAARRPAVRVVAAVCAVAGVLGGVPVAVVVSGWPPTGALMVACDVGQGDSIVLPIAPGRAVVVDAGPEPAATDRCLRELRIREVSLLLISHYHADHVGGVDGVFRGRRVDEVAVGSFPDPVAGRQEVLGEAAGHHIPVVVPGLGWRWAQGPLSLTVLGPIGRVTGTDSDPNNNSLIVMAVADGVRMLLPGDAEAQEQTEVLATDGRDALRADVLKVAHHGSANQDQELLDAVHPSIALVSVGVGNPYGHPNLPMLAHLARNGARVLRTDQDGDVAAVLDRGGLATVRHGSSPGRRPP